MRSRLLDALCLIGSDQKLRRGGGAEKEGWRAEPLRKVIVAKEQMLSPTYFSWNEPTHTVGEREYKNENELICMNPGQSDSTTEKHSSFFNIMVCSLHGRMKSN